MRKYITAVGVLLVLTSTFTTQAFAAPHGHNVVRNAWKLDKKLRKDPNVVKVQADYVVGGGGGRDVFIVYVKDCYNEASRHHIPTWYKGTEVRLYCTPMEP